jgi:hypothetical protein
LQLYARAALAPPAPENAGQPMSEGGSVFGWDRPAPQSHESTQP